MLERNCRHIHSRFYLLVGIITLGGQAPAYTRRGVCCFVLKARLTWAEMMGCYVGPFCRPVCLGPWWSRRLQSGPRSP